MFSMIEMSAKDFSNINETFTKLTKVFFDYSKKKQIIFKFYILFLSL